MGINRAFGAVSYMGIRCIRRRSPNPRAVVRCGSGFFEIVVFIRGDPRRVAGLRRSGEPHRGEAKPSGRFRACCSACRGSVGSRAVFAVLSGVCGGVSGEGLGRGRRGSLFCH